MVLECNGDGADGAAGAVDDFERCGDDQRAGGWELLQVDQAGEAEFACSVQEGVRWEGRVKDASLARIGANRFHAEAKNVAFFDEELRAILV